jgi:NAD(P)-dependent dehydrogenase (short-subunit alcohol dehydrogenase family)
MYRAKPQDGVAWVTGASSGIGAATALELARRGYLVVATARREGALQALAQRASRLSGRIEPLAGDVTDRAAMAAAVRFIEAEISPIALAFLNVGIFQPDGADDFGDDSFRQIFEVNVMGTINCLGPVVAAMLARTKGQVAINASLAGYGGLPRSAAYGASKAALINLAESIRLQFARRGLTTQIVNLGFVRTPMTANNTFRMPFLLPVEEAGRRICDGFERAGFEITFPYRLSVLVKAVNLLPYAAYFGAIRLMTGTGK